MMRKAALVSLASMIAVSGAFLPSISTAQQARSLQFEVATIRPGSPPTDPRMGESWSTGGAPGGQFRMVNTPLKQWVEMGLSVSDDALKTPSWLDTARFDLNAKIPADAPTNRNTTPEMIRALLIERFDLKWHEESQIVSGYQLVPDKKVLLQPATPLEQRKGHGSGSGPTLIQGTNMPLSELVEALGKVLGKPVVDATHLAGVFTFALKWRPSEDIEAAAQKHDGVEVDALPSTLFTAVQEQLGLRLQSAKVPSRVIVVDNINRQPTGN